MRYAANLLFAYHVADGRKRSLCEKRIVIVQAHSPSAALRKARVYGRGEECRYRNVYGRHVSVRFVGLVDLLDLDGVCGPEEVWYSMFSTSDPRRFTKPDSELSVFRGGVVGAALWAVPRDEAAKRKYSETKKGRTSRAM
jgi:hypothetical protein